MRTFSQCRSDKLWQPLKEGKRVTAVTGWFIRTTQKGSNKDKNLASVRCKLVLFLDQFIHFILLPLTVKSVVMTFANRSHWSASTLDLNKTRTWLSEVRLLADHPFLFLQLQLLYIPSFWDSVSQETFHSFTFWTTPTMFMTLSLTLFFLTCTRLAAGHVGLWDPSMFGRCGNDNQCSL